MTMLSRILRKRITSSIIAILVGFIVAAIVIAAAGYNPIDAFGSLFYGSLGKARYISNVIIKATPILLTGVGVAFAYKVGLFNIGAEGQYIAGTICSVIVGYTLNLPAPIQIPLVILAGVIGGALMGALVGWLKARFGVHEVITSIMCNWIMLYLNNFIVSVDFFHEANSTSTHMVNSSSFTMILPNWKMTEEGQAALSSIPGLKDVLVRTDVNVGIIIAIIVAILASMLLSRTKLGYEMRAVGLNRDAARASGVDVNKNIMLSMIISGGICGLGGALSITGMAPHALSQLSAFENNGFNGLSVAFIAATSPIGCIPASFLFSALIYGGQTVQQVWGVPSEIINIMIGTIVFFTALVVIVPKLADHLDVRKAKELERKEAGDAA